nr:ABC transporter substrate-binding protein [Nocardioides alcanivorans]
MLKANPDYWAGAPALKSLRFVYMPHQQASLDSLASGEVDMTLVTDPEKVAPLIEAGTPAYVSMVGVGSMVLVNASEGRAGADPRVRQAMALAVAPESVSSRAYGGKALASTTMFPDYSRWHSSTVGPENDPDRARELVKDAKADGFDGKLVYRSVNDPGARNSALAAKASLEAVGFEVELDFARDISQLIGKVAVERDYDLAKWGLNYRDADPFSKMYATLHSEGGQGFGMATSPELDALLLELQGAEVDAQGIAVMDKIQQKINELVPFLNFGPFAEVITWNDNVHDITGSGSTMVLFDTAWVEG